MRFVCLGLHRIQHFAYYQKCLRLKKLNLYYNCPFQIYLNFQYWTILVGYYFVDKFEIRQIVELVAGFAIGLKIVYYNDVEAGDQEREIS